MSEIKWKTQEEIKREQEERNNIPTDKEKIRMLEDENRELQVALAEIYEVMMEGSL